MFCNWTFGIVALLCSDFHTCCSSEINVHFCAWILSWPGCLFVFLPSQWYRDPCQFFFKTVIEIEPIMLFTLTELIVVWQNYNPRCTEELDSVSLFNLTSCWHIWVAKDGDNHFSSVHSQMHCGVLRLLSLQFCLTPCILQEDPYAKRNVRHRVCSACEDTALAEHNCWWEPSASPMAVLKSLRKGVDIWLHYHTAQSPLTAGRCKAYVVQKAQYGVFMFNRKCFRHP